VDVWKARWFCTVQRLPGGFYLKYNGNPDEARNEANALRMVQKHTNISVPEPLDLVIKEQNPEDPFSLPDAWLLITQVPGLPLSECHVLMSDRDLELKADQLRGFVAQLRAIPNEFETQTPICNTLGQAIRDHRVLGGQPVGPCEDEAAFNKNVRFPDDPARQGHKILFTHADLNPRNILVEEVTQPDGSRGWAVTGIVDWETAGFYPEYWDFTKALFERFRWPKRYNSMVKGVFKEFGDYSKEMDVEIRSWESGDGV
jgi:aminoglycoside phosphotransferase (APT) family kinase protein